MSAGVLCTYIFSSKPLTSMDFFFQFLNVLRVKKKWFFLELFVERFFEEPKWFFYGIFAKNPFIKLLVAFSEAVCSKGGQTQRWQTCVIVEITCQAWNNARFVALRTSGMCKTTSPLSQDTCHCGTASCLHGGQIWRKWRSHLATVWANTQVQ